MKHKYLIEEVSNKYGYNEQLQIAINLTIDLMLKEYGEDKIDDIYNLFRNIRIFSTSDMSKDNRDKIEKEMIGNYNSNIIDKKDDDPYQNDSDPGSYYSYQAIYDENMNVTGEARWIVVKDMKGSIQEEGYKNIFGTTINIPYFIHEIGHAFVMQNATYVKEENKIYSKHGMYEEVITFDKKDNKFEIDADGLNSIILEESINEFSTQNMLKELLKVDDYTIVRQQLDSIGHVSTAYNSVLLSLTEKLEKILGKEQLLNYRRNNDKKVIDEFNLIASQSEIVQKYCPGDLPFSMFDKKCYALYLLENKKYTMTSEQYGERNKQLMMDAFVPLCAYQDKKYGTMPFATYEEVRNEVLGINVDLIVEKENKTK